MPKLESCIKIKVDQPTQAQRLIPPYGRKPRKTPKPPISLEPAQEPDNGG